MLLCLLTAVGQNCSDLVTSRFQALVNRSISRTCLRCVDGNMMADSSTLWDTPYGVVSQIANTAPELFELVDGVLVLLDPMQLLEDGDNSYEVTCTAGTFEYSSRGGSRAWKRGVLFLCGQTTPISKPHPVIINALYRNTDNVVLSLKWILTSGGWRNCVPVLDHQGQASRSDQLYHYNEPYHVIHCNTYRLANSQTRSGH